MQSSSRRLHTNSEDNIRTDHGSIFRLKKIRLNTIQNQEEILIRESSLIKSRSKGFLAPISPVKFYETKLTLSCEAWCVYNIESKKYKRGWKPNKSAEFNGLIKVIIAKIYLDLLSQHKQIQSLMFRVNKYLLGHSKKESSPLKQLHKTKIGEKHDPNSLVQNTIINLKDMFVAMTITNSSQLLEYTLVFVGYLISKIRQSSEFFISHTENIILESAAERGILIKQFIDYANEDLKQHSYNETYCTASLQLYSTPHQMCQIYSDLIENHKIYIIMMQTRQVSTIIRYQMGYKFYQDRVKKFFIERMHPANHILTNCRGKSNFGVISYNKVTLNVIVLFDCKFCMAEVDVSRIEEWLKGMSKPIVGQSRLPSSKLLPLLKLLE